MTCDDEGSVPPTGDDQAADPAEEVDEVGYKRPPKKHRFKKGQNPPPRKRERAAKSESPRKLLARLLAEPRRGQVGRRVLWFSTGELLVRKAFEVAERSPTIHRLLVDLQFQAEPVGEPEAVVILDRLDGSPPKIIGGDDYPALARAYAAAAKGLARNWVAGALWLPISGDGGHEGD